jgi:hypothetical protein
VQEWVFFTFGSAVRMVRNPFPTLANGPEWEEETEKSLENYAWKVVRKEEDDVVWEIKHKAVARIIFSPPIFQ